PSMSPAATAIASPSRQTRTRGKPSVPVNALSHVPNSLSGSQTTCVTPLRLRAATVEGPSSIVIGHLSLVIGASIRPQSAYSKPDAVAFPKMTNDKSIMTNDKKKPRQHLLTGEEVSAAEC